MKELDISAKITVCCYEELNETEKKLIECAKKSCHTAYSPYSNFSVGAALLLKNGEIISGSNQENAAYPSGLCAERTTLFYANAHAPGQAVTLMAIAAYTNEAYTEKPITPCGACLQVMCECEKRYKQPIKLLLYSTQDIYIITKVCDLLPLNFDNSILKRQ